MTGTRSHIGGKTVLVTGGTGTVGTAIVRRLLRTDAAAIRIYSRDEHKQFERRQELPADDRLRFFIGDTRDLERLRRACEGVNVVFHAAAMKHVFACEYNPFEAIKTNIVGTQNIVEAATDAGVARVLFASSDKAVSPTSIMGVSKLMAEKVITAANVWRGDHSTVFSSVRFGNVIGSRGSVIPLFMRQAAAGGPVTLTDRRMTRFMMSIEHAVDLMFDALDLAVGGEVFVLKMPAVRIEHLAHVLREHVAASKDLIAEDIAIKEIGLQLGEKLAEELLTDEEFGRALETDEMYIILPQIRSLQPDADYRYPGARRATSVARSDVAEPLEAAELLALLAECNVLSDPDPVR
jgi:UDP-N-acetylglucosamine 4,6-dehydratase/5-epimerase